MMTTRAEFVGRLSSSGVPDSEDQAYRVMATRTGAAFACRVFARDIAETKGDAGYRTPARAPAIP